MCVKVCLSGVKSNVPDLLTLITVDELADC